MKPLIIANWKMNPPTLKEARALFDLVKKGVKSIRKAEVIICPPFIYMPLLKGIAIGAQDCFWEREGAYTGEVSPAMIKNLGCDYVIVGHSERRKYFDETDEIVNKKIKAALSHKLIPIFCVGETQEERNKEETPQILKKQIEAGLKNISNFSGVIAYEPVWAIGTGNACDIEEAQKMMLLIKKILSNLGFSKKTPVLYGGSVKSSNAKGYMKEAGFDGLLVGSASLKSEEFISIIRVS